MSERRRSLPRFEPTCIMSVRPRVDSAFPLRYKPRQRHVSYRVQIQLAKPPRPGQKPPWEEDEEQV